MYCRTGDQVTRPGGGLSTPDGGGDWILIEEVTHVLISRYKADVRFLEFRLHGISNKGVRDPCVRCNGSSN